MKLIKAPCGLHCIKIKDFGVSYGDEPVLSDVNLHIHCGTLTVLIGQNGAGKSTLVRALINDLPHTGTVEFKDREDGNLQKIKIGYVPQRLSLDRNTPVSVYDLFASYESKIPVFLWKSKKFEAQVKEALSLFEAEDLIDEKVSNLSGGQLQRVLLSLAVMDRPNLLILDEPVSGVDANGLKNFYLTLDELKQKFDMAILLISHDLDYVARYADRVVLLDHTIKKQGGAGEVFKSPEFKEIFGIYGKQEGGEHE